MRAPDIDEDEVQMVYNWIDEIPLSRPKRNITRDFADGCLLAEVVHHFLPKTIELHNYSQAHSTQQKLYNWQTLNAKPFKKLGFQVHKDDIHAIINAEPMAVEKVLRVFQGKMANFLSRKKKLHANEVPERAAYAHPEESKIREDFHQPGVALIEHDEVRE